MSKGKPSDRSNASVGTGVLIDRLEDVLTFTLDSVSSANCRLAFDALTKGSLALIARPEAQRS